MLLYPESHVNLLRKPNNCAQHSVHERSLGKPLRCNYLFSIFFPVRNHPRRDRVKLAPVGDEISHREADPSKTYKIIFIYSWNECEIIRKTNTCDYLHWNKYTRQLYKTHTKQLNWGVGMEGWTIKGVNWAIFNVILPEHVSRNGITRQMM